MSSASEQVTHRSPYELLTATRFDQFLLKLKWNNDEFGPCAFLLLRYHLDRLRNAAEQHGWNEAKSSLTYDSIKAACQSALTSQTDHRENSNALKIRLSLSESGALLASATPAPPFTSDPTSASFFNPTSDNPSLFGPLLKIYIDSKPTSPSLFTATKTTERAVYNDARSRVGLPLLPSIGAPDVLLYNSQGLITETSIFNIAFYRSHSWLTPSTSTGCLPGVLRRWLLEQGRIHEDKQNNTLTKDQIRDGDWVLLFNGVQGCRLGRVVMT